MVLNYYLQKNPSKILMEARANLGILVNSLGLVGMNEEILIKRGLTEGSQQY
jgi:hypothetical protein